MDQTYRHCSVRSFTPCLPPQDTRQDGLAAARSLLLRWQALPSRPRQQWRAASTVRPCPASKGPEPGRIDPGEQGVGVIAIACGLIATPSMARRQTALCLPLRLWETRPPQPGNQSRRLMRGLPHPPHMNRLYQGWKNAYRTLPGGAGREPGTCVGVLTRDAHTRSIASACMVGWWARRNGARHSSTLTTAHAITSGLCRQRLQ